MLTKLRQVVNENCCRGGYTFQMQIDCGGFGRFSFKLKMINVDFVGFAWWV